MARCLAVVVALGMAAAAGFVLGVAVGGLVPPVDWPALPGLP